jgi:hypothetical protein
MIEPRSHPPSQVSRGPLECWVRPVSDRRIDPDLLVAVLQGCRGRLALGSGLVMLSFAVVELCSFARTPRRFTTGAPSYAYRLLSDQLSDYGVDIPYIQARIHGLRSRSVPDLDDLPTVLRDEEVSGSNPVTPTTQCPGQSPSCHVDQRPGLSR